MKITVDKRMACIFISGKSVQSHTASLDTHFIKRTDYNNNHKAKKSVSQVRKNRGGTG